jgi:hypothetical protein
MEVGHFARMLVAYASAKTGKAGRTGYGAMSARKLFSTLGRTPRGLKPRHRRAVADISINLRQT